jgi:WS/DGAT/MGAT family acyltransferase
VPDRLGQSDAAVLREERPEAPQHVGTVLVLQPVAGRPLDPEVLADHIAGRIAFVPRYRQRLLHVPAGLAAPVWVDDVRFDPGYHIRQTAVPRPGTDRQMCEIVGRVSARALDRGRPLWEAYVVDGLADGALAVVTKTHQVLVDEEHAVDLAQVLLDDEPLSPASPPTSWSPASQPSAGDLVASAVLGAVAHPVRLRVLARPAIAAVDAAVGLARTADQAARPGRQTRGPLEAVPSPHRRFAAVRTDLADYQRVARRVGEVAVTVHDVVLAVLAGALRVWLQRRGNGAVPVGVLRAAAPVAVDGPGTVDSHVVDLPVGEPNPVLRLHQVAFQATPRTSVPARELADLAGFAPPTWHALGARVAARLGRRAVDLVVTNVPGPQQPRYAAGALLRESYPVMPLRHGHALAVGVTSYDGHVYHGLTGDWDAVGDLDALADAIPEALAELLEQGS